MHIYHRNKIYLTILYRFFTWLYICITVISAMWNFWGFGLKRRHLIFADFVSCWLKIAAPKKMCLHYRNQQLKRCYDKQLVQITVTLRSKNILSSLKVFKRYNIWIRIWLISNLSLETIFSLFSRSILLTGNTKSTVGSISV